MHRLNTPLKEGVLQQCALSDGLEAWHAHQVRVLQAPASVRTCKGEVRPHGWLNTFNQVALFGVGCCHEEYTLGVGELRRKFGLLLTQSTDQQDPSRWLQTVQGRLQYEGYALRHCHAAVLFLKSRKVLLLGDTSFESKELNVAEPVPSPLDCCVRAFRLAGLESVELGLRTRLGEHTAHSSVHVHQAAALAAA